jgi:hydrogenase-1 operon protein HyaF
MAGLEEIGVAIEPSGFSTGNVRPLLAEIAHALSQLVDNGKSSTIDLLSLPLSTDDLKELEKRLGAGEIQISMNALGPSHLRETGIAGVWLIEHFNADDEIVARMIEIAPVPAIVPADIEDMREGLAGLQAQLQEH